MAYAKSFPRVGPSSMWVRVAVVVEFSSTLAHCVFYDLPPWWKSCILRIFITMQWGGNVWRKSLQISMTCTSNLTKPHFVTHCVHLTGTPLRLDAGPTRGTYLITLLAWCLHSDTKTQRWEKTIRIEVAPCQQQRSPRKCNFLIKGVVVAPSQYLGTDNEDFLFLN